MDKMREKIFMNFWIIIVVMLVLVPITISNNFYINTNGFVIIPYVLCIFCVAVSDFITEAIIKKSTVFLIVDGETKSSIHLWSRSILRKINMYGLATALVALLIIHLVARPMSGYVNSINDIPWMGIVLCMLFMIFLTFILNRLYEALILKQLRLNKAKTYFFYLGIFFSTFNDFNIPTIEHLIVIYVLIGAIVVMVTKANRKLEIERFYEEDLS